MTLAERIARLRADVAAKIEQRNEKAVALNTERDAETPDEAKITALRAEVRGLDTEIDTLSAQVAEFEAERARDDVLTARAAEFAPAERPAYDEVARVGSEPRTYTREKNMRGESSFFADAFGAMQLGDFAARQRIERHMTEVRVEGELNERSNTTASAGSLVVPQYLVDLAALALRSGRPFANLVTRDALPDQGMAFFVPRFTTASATAVQATQNTAVQNTAFAVTDLQVDVRTIAGEIQPSRQLLERGAPGIDALIYLDLAGAYHANLDSQCISGTGASGQILGALNTAGIGTATAFGAAVTAATVNTKTAGAVAALAGAGTAITPRAIVMHPRRWGWLLGQNDSTGRPLVVPNSSSPWNAQGVNLDPGAYGSGDATSTDAPVVVGTFQGLPVITDSNIPTNVGTNVEDVMLVVDPTKIYLWEDNGGAPNQLRFDQTSGNALQVRLVVYGYAAFTAGRYPGAVNRVGGADTGGAGAWGLVAPTF